ncbi:hypothetical protein [Microvirga aerophila]|uniref:Uncharacterized protein n=1 Tax=Microvirga aerophila TaxID=670291 RepID=A0A512BP90_9HYPH|nr:hypothetical protein [Microvirga aerophila]GEO13773.1 hypothetical protein MAE02_14690 [Microvirga aerophila]
MDDLTSKMNGATVEEVLAATEADVALAPELAQAREVKLVPGMPQPPQWEKQYEPVT